MVGILNAMLLYHFSFHKWSSHVESLFEPFLGTINYVQIQFYFLHLYLLCNQFYRKQWRTTTTKTTQRSKRKMLLSERQCACNYCTVKCKIFINCQSVFEIYSICFHTTKLKEAEERKMNATHKKLCVNYANRLIEGKWEIISLFFTRISSIFMAFVSFVFVP